MNLPKLVKKAIHEIDPNAEVILFGSRARKDYTTDSDWDFLILLSLKAAEPLKRQIRDRLFELELQTNEIISSIIEFQEEWPEFKITPLYQNIEIDGIMI